MTYKHEYGYVCEKCGKARLLTEEEIFEKNISNYQ